jgi:hypothetical protein
MKCLSIPSLAKAGKKLKCTTTVVFMEYSDKKQGALCAERDLANQTALLGNKQGTRETNKQNTSRYYAVFRKILGTGGATIRSSTSTPGMGIQSQQAEAGPLAR